MVLLLPDSTEIEALYDRNLFLQAYGRTRDFWKCPEVAAQLSIPDLVLAGRLAQRLGSVRLRRWLFRLARVRAPEHQLVRYYSALQSGEGASLYRTVLQSENAQPFEFEDAVLNSNWLAVRARAWAFFRDFETAHALLEREAAIGVTDAWSLACRAQVLLLEDRWTEALDTVEEAWRMSTGMPSAGAVLGQCLLKLGRLDDAAMRLEEQARHGESWEILALAVWYMTIRAQRVGDPERRMLLARQAYDLSMEFDRCAPLADREALKAIAWQRVAVSLVLGDRDLMRRHAAECPFFARESVLKRLDAASNGSRILVNCRSLAQKHNTCLPASIATALSALGCDIDHDALSRDLTWGGTAEWQAGEWLKRTGYIVRHFLASADVVRALLHCGVPVVLSLASESNSHAVTIIGLDESFGVFIIHDPSTACWMIYPVEEFATRDAPVGPAAMVIVPPAMEESLEVIPEDVQTPMTAFTEYWRQSAREGASAAESVISDLAKTYSTHPVTRRLRAIAHLRRGETAEGIKVFTELLREFPNCVPLRQDILPSLYQVGSMAFARQTLSEIVEKGMLPGVPGSQAWRHVPAAYVAEYAELIGYCAPQRMRARKMLERAIEREPLCPEALHSLGGLQWNDGEQKAAGVSYRLAAMLREENEHYARAAADALRWVNRENDALEFLRRRAQRAGHRGLGGPAWTTWASALEDYGHPDQAEAVAVEAQQRFPDASPVLSWLVCFWVRRGDWSCAEATLARLSSEHQADRAEAETYFLWNRGRWHDALECAEKWMASSPDSISARKWTLRLVPARDGCDAPLRLTESWLLQRPGHDDFEHLHYVELRSRHRPEEACALLRSRIERNPEDGWALREICFLLLERLKSAPHHCRRSLEDELDHLLIKAERVAPEHESTLALIGERLRLSDLTEDAAEFLLRAVDIAPGMTHAYNRLWQWSETWPPARQRELLNRLEERMLAGPGAQCVAGVLAANIAARFGRREALRRVTLWMERAPDHPDILEAYADLALDQENTHAAAHAVLASIQPTADRFPDRVGLGLSVVQALIQERQQDAAIERLRQMLQRDPLHRQTRWRLAAALAKSGDVATGESLMREAITMTPASSDAHGDMAQFYVNANRSADAIGVLLAALKAMPLEIGLREQCIQNLLDAGRRRDALDAAIVGVRLHPRGAWLWQVLGRTWQGQTGILAVKKAHSCFRRALALNPALFPAADELAAAHASRAEWDAAREVLKTQIPLLENPLPALCALARLTRSEGNHGEARRELAQAAVSRTDHNEAWALLLNWIEDDEAWTKSRELLAQFPQAVLDDLDVKARHLILRRKAGESRKRLDAEWAALLAGIPQAENPPLLRFDDLVEQADWPRALEAIEAAEKSAPDSPYVLSRKVKALTVLKRNEDAFRTAERLWSVPGGEGWADRTAWEALRAAGLQRKATRAVMSMLERGAHVRASTFDCLQEDLSHLRSDRFDWDPRHWSSKGRVKRNLLRELEVLDRFDWDHEGRYRAHLMWNLRQQGHHRAIAEYVRRHPEPCRRLTRLWEEAGYAILTHSRAGVRRMRAWMADWREHPGISMSLVSRYSNYLRGLGLTRQRHLVPRISPDLEELYRTCRDVLQSLPWDNTARYQVLSLCESSIRLGRYDDFADAMRRYGEYLRVNHPGDYVPSGYEWAIEAMFLFQKVLSDLPQKELCETSLRLLRLPRPHRLWANWLAPAWERSVTGRLSRVRILFIRLRTFFG